jgi:L-cysteine:1D-myo-inositol 2-amino-2-deoxy-alpha-D-glucopyranoside ligase
MISLDGEKMSKSRGNLVFVSTLRADGVDPAAIRVALLAGHYRADRPWSADLLDQASDRLAAWRLAAKRSGAVATPVLTELRAALADDLDTPAALAVLDRWADDETLDGALVADAADALLGVSLA